MNKINILKKIAGIVAFLFFVIFLSGCVKNKGLVPEPENPLPSQDSYFDFSTKAEVKINVDYKKKDYKALVEIYTENPYSADENGFSYKNEAKPVYMGYTDENCKLSGTVYLPSIAEKVYIASNYIGLPSCVEAEVGANGIQYEYDLTMGGSTKASAGTGPSDCRNFAGTGGDGKPLTIDKTHRVYSICTSWNRYGKPDQSDIYFSAREESGLLKRVQNIVGKNSTASKKQNNSNLISSDQKTNISISKKSADGQEISGAHLDLVFLHERAGYRSSLGYYYYPTPQNPGEITAEYIKKLPKYVVFPNVNRYGDDPYGSWSYQKQLLEPNTAVRLQFFGENYDQPAADEFPSGYTVGWFILSNTFKDGNRSGQIGYENDKVFYSNSVANPKGESLCITIYDRKSEKMIIGFEDALNSGYMDWSYEDILFYVQADPVKAIVDPENPGIPSIDDKEDIDIPDKTYISSQGTLAFEDIWPSGGDYDLNDVVVEYTTEVTFDKDNKVKKIVDAFKDVYDGAGLENAFAYQIVPGQEGTMSLPEGSVYEQETNSVIVFSDSKAALNKTFVIERTFDGPLYKDALESYNPFIIVGYKDYDKNSRNRIEVHLPKTDFTSKANRELQGTADDAYFIRKDDGLRPFAIDIPVLDFKVANEKTDIGIAYEKFNDWAKSKGEKEKDWYLFPAAGRVVGK